MTIILKKLIKEVEYEEWEYCCEEFRKANDGYHENHEFIMRCIYFHPHWKRFVIVQDRSNRKLKFCPWCGASLEIEVKK